MRSSLEVAAARLDAVRSQISGLFLITEAAILCGVADAEALVMRRAEIVAERTRIRVPETRGFRQ
jgi:hypothetical protein